MSQVTIYGVAASSYVRTALTVCGVKGVDHSLEEVALGTDAHRELHPYLKIPALRHGDFHLFETTAIARYVDEAFDGPPLQPKDARARAVMEQWISTFNSQMYGALIARYALQYIFPRGADGAPDRTTIDAAVPEIRQAAELLDRACGANGFLAGDEPSIADYLVVPALVTARAFPEAGDIIGGHASLRRAIEAVERRPGYRGPPNPT